jgi:hypothetical protein
LVNMLNFSNDERLTGICGVVSRRGEAGCV